jgi:ribosomal protein S18 acetylase RimI-like enzyme
MDRMSVVRGSDIAKVDKGRFVAARKMLARAFFDYPLMVYAVPDAARRFGPVETLYTAILRDAFAYGEVYASPETEGVACWMPPGIPLPGLFREIRAGLFSLPSAYGWQKFRMLVEYGRCHTKVHHELVQGPHWFLACIGVDPTHQGKGIGSALLESVVTKADEQRLPCYLETHKEENVRLYERHGFVVARVCQVPGHPIPFWPMVRPARS